MAGTRTRTYPVSLGDEDSLQTEELSKTHLRNWDLLVEGSPTIQTLISPRRWIPSWVCLCTPPMSWSRIPFLTISWPEIDQPWHSTPTKKCRRGHTIDGRGDTRYETLVNVVGMDHCSELFNLFTRERVEEGVLVLGGLFGITTDID